MLKADSTKRVLITGGAGFVGYHLAKRLAAAGHNVAIAENFFRGKRDEDFDKLLSLPNVSLIEGDLSCPGAWQHLGGNYDEVYHLAGINGTRLFYEMPHEVLRIGITTTLNALEWFRSHNKPGAKIIYASSNEAYAGAFEAFGSLPIPTPETMPLVIADPYNPRWSYAGQKLIGELLFINYSRAYHLRMAIVRPHNFYGPRAGYDHVIPEIIARIWQRTEPFPLFGADHMRSFCYIEDAVAAMQKVMEASVTDGGTYHIGSRDELSIKALAEQIFTLAGWRPRHLVSKDSPQGSVKRRLADVSKIKKDIEWEASTSLETGLRKTMDWYLAQPPQQKPRSG
jgi:nucleoside-diphosphate-sugar epimerase